MPGRHDPRAPIAPTRGSDRTSHTYDVHGNLLSVEIPGSPTKLVEYKVDGEGRRVEKTVKLWWRSVASSNEALAPI